MMDNLKSAYQRTPSSVKKAAAVGAVAFAAPYLVPVIIYPLGWTATGVKAGSVAAAWQTTMGGTILKGSTFPLLQKAAMTAAL